MQEYAANRAQHQADHHIVMGLGGGAKNASNGGRFGNASIRSITRNWLPPSGQRLRWGSPRRRKLNRRKLEMTSVSWHKGEPMPSYNTPKNCWKKTTRSNSCSRDIGGKSDTHVRHREQRITFFVKFAVSSVPSVSAR